MQGAASLLDWLRRYRPLNRAPGMHCAADAARNQQPGEETHGEASLTELRDEIVKRWTAILDRLVHDRRACLIRCFNSSVGITTTGNHHRIQTRADHTLSALGYVHARNGTGCGRC